MTNAQQKALAAERYPELSPADARKALRRDLKAEREHDNVIRLYQRYQEQCRKDAEDVARFEADLAQSGAAQRVADPDAVDMAGIAQTPRRQPRRRLNPFMAALVGGLLIGMKGDER